MKRKLAVLIVLLLLGSATYASAQTGSDGLGMVWKAIAFLQLEIEFLAGQIGKTTSVHLYDAHGVDLGIVVDSNFPTLSGGRVFRVFDPGRRAFVGFSDFGTTAAIASSIPTGRAFYAQANCLGQPVWDRPFPGETFVYAADFPGGDDDLIHVMAITTEFLGHFDALSSGTPGSGCLNGPTALENVFETVELKLPYVNPQVGAIVAAPLSIR